MIEITLLNGQMAAIKPEEFERLRPGFLPSEAGAPSVLFAAELHLCRDDPEALAGKFAERIPVIRLTTPNDLAIHVAAKKVARVLPANEAEHHPNAKAVLDLPGVMQQVRETVEEVVAKIRAATGG